MMKDGFDRYVGTAEAARTLGISEATFRRWANTGRIQVMRAPNGRIVHKDEVARVQAERRDESGRSLSRSAA